MGVIIIVAWLIWFMYIVSRDNQNNDILNQRVERSLQAKDKFIRENTDYMTENRIMLYISDFSHKDDIDLFMKNVYNESGVTEVCPDGLNYDYTYNVYAKNIDLLALLSKKGKIPSIVTEIDYCKNPYCIDDERGAAFIKFMSWWGSQLKENGFHGELVFIKSVDTFPKRNIGESLAYTHESNLIPLEEVSVQDKGVYTWKERIW